MEHASDKGAGMAGKLVRGIYTAVLTPRHADETVDTESLAVLIRFQAEKGIRSFAMNGATGEFPLTTHEHLEAILATVQEASCGKAEILCGVGAPGIAGVKALMAVAQSAGVKALLLPMPCFFPYQQQDLELFCREAAASTELPILLYNLPQFTSGVQKETVRRLIVEVPNIIGIKDSSGSLDILEDLTSHKIDACRIVGNDSALAPALKAGVCDGVVSGVACALPEIIQAVYGEPTFTEAARLLDEFIDKLAGAPTPWGLKWMAEARGIVPATFSQPVTATRDQQGKEMAAWLKDWLPAALAAVSKTASTK
jgi:4-hydroxy-tetrahydrodipicolinate synthase